MKYYLNFVVRSARPSNFALRKALLITFSGYLQLLNKFLNSFNLYSAISSFETKTIIRLARLYGALSLERSECVLS